MSHFPISPLTCGSADGWFDGSRALLSTATLADTALVFLHGWGGTASDTWEAFPEALRLSPRAAHVDAFFLQYPSREHRVAFCAAPVASIVRDLLRHPLERVISGALPPGTTRPPFIYSRVVLVGHSMGAVVARRALLDIFDELTEEDRSRLRMLFFAPAHTGSSLPRLLTSGLGLDWLPGGALVGAALTSYYVSLQDLAEGSACLTALAEDARIARLSAVPGAVSPADAPGYLRARVWHARDDKVVSQERFDADWPLQPVMGRNHRSICKPGLGYTRPIDAVHFILDEAIPQ